MAITTNATRIRVESAAKNGTLGSQSGAGTKQIIFDTNISTNNSNLEASPSFEKRHVVIRRGETDEECQLIQSVEVDGVTCNVYNTWDSAPVSGDTYDIAYKLEDMATIAGCTFETDSRQWVMTKRVVVGTPTVFGYLGMSHGQILRCWDTGTVDYSFRVAAVGRFEIGTLKNDVAERGAQILFDANTNGEEAIEFLNGSVSNLYEFAMHSMRAPDGVVGLLVTVGATADVKWARSQSSGMNTPFKNTYQRVQDIETIYYEDVAAVKLAPWYTGHMQSETDQTIKDAIVGKADGDRVRILIEEG